MITANNKLVRLPCNKETIEKLSKENLEVSIKAITALDHMSKSVTKQLTCLNPYQKT